MDLFGYSEKDFDFSQNYQTEQEYIRFRNKVKENKNISEFLMNINWVLSVIEDTEALKIFQKTGNDKKRIKVCQSIVEKDLNVSAFIDELNRVNGNFDVFRENFSKYIYTNDLYMQKVQEAQQYNNIDFQEDKIRKLNEDIGLCNEEIGRIDKQFEEYRDYRDKLQNVNVDNYRFGGKEELLGKSKMLNDDAKEILYLFIQTFEEYINNSKSWLSNSRSVTLEEEYKRQQEVLIGDLDLTLQQLKINRDEVINNLHEIEVRILDITSANERLSEEKQAISEEIENLKKEKEFYIGILNVEFGKLPLLTKIQQKRILFKSQKDLESLLNILRDFNDNRNVFTILFQNEEVLQFYSFLFENRLNKNKAKLFCVKYYLEKEGIIAETIDKSLVDFEVVPKDSWVYYLESSLYDRVLSNENKGREIETLISNSGKWSYLYSDVFAVDELCEQAVSTQVCSCIKHSDSNEGVCCFYIDGKDIEAHKRVISFMMANDLLKHTSNGVLYDISFKFDEQNSRKIMLSHFVNLETGKFKEI